MQRNRDCIVRQNRAPRVLDFVMDDDIVMTERERQLQAQITELEAFAHTIAHQIKSPLGIISGYASLLSNDNDSSSLNERQQYLAIIQETALRMAEVVDQLMLLGNPDAVDLRPVDLRVIVDDVLERLAPMIADCQAEILVPERWPVAVGHAAWIEEVWVNYLTNALKYGGCPPQIELGATHQMNGHVRFWIQDNGPGIAQDEHERLFEPFVRLHTDQRGGHGLGLSIVRRIVRQMDGHVYIESLPGGGSVFGFILPEA